jgi:hypothetical protein
LRIAVSIPAHRPPWEHLIPYRDACRVFKRNTLLCFWSVVPAGVD